MQNDQAQIYGSTLEHSGCRCITQHYLQTDVLAVALLVSPGCTASPVSEGWNLDDNEINV